MSRKTQSQTPTSDPADCDDSKDPEIVYLVPELCYLLGPNDIIMQRKASQREIKKITKVDAPIAIQRLEQFIEIIKNKDSKATEILENWGIHLDGKPQKVAGYRLNPGHIIMGHKSLSITSQQKLEQDFTVEKDLDQEF